MKIALSALLALEAVVLPGGAAVIYHKLDVPWRAYVHSESEQGTDIPQPAIDINNDGIRDAQMVIGSFEINMLLREGVRLYGNTITFALAPGTVIGAERIFPFGMWQMPFGGGGFLPDNWLFFVNIMQPLQVTPGQGLLKLVADNFAFQNGRSGYIGVQLEVNKKLHYGWIGIDGSRKTFAGEITGWAWETEPGKAIIAGSIPEPTAPLLVVISFLGLMVLRRRPP